MATPPNTLSNLSWKAPDVEASLAELRQYVESQAQRQIDWYYRKKALKARVSTTLRLLAIVLSACGGLVPIFKSTLNAATIQRLPFDFGGSGYLLIGAAAGCLAMDHYFGYSTGWIRYITTAMAIEKSLEEFRMEWTRNYAKLRGGPPTEEQLDQLIQTCETFSLAIKSQVEQETNAWVAEFQSNLTQLEKDLQSRADEVKSRSKAATA